VLPDELTLPLLVAGLIVAYVLNADAVIDHAVLVRLVFGRKITADERIPFGPYLCLATWLIWLYGPLVL